MKSLEYFECDMCGLCCQNLKLSEIYSSLDRGDGVCKYYEQKSHRCLIYENRPVICNIEKYYQEYLLGAISKSDYLALNYDACIKLKQGVLKDATRRKSNS